MRVVCSACYPTIYLSIHLSIHLSICLSTHLSIYLSHAQRDTMANLRGLMAKQRELRHVVYMYSHWLGLGLALELGSG